MPKILVKFQRNYPNGGAKYTWGKKKCDFQQISA